MLQNVLNLWFLLGFDWKWWFRWRILVRMIEFHCKNLLIFKLVSELHHRDITNQSCLDSLTHQKWSRNPKEHIGDCASAVSVCFSLSFHSPMCPIHEYAREHKNLLCSLFNNVFHLGSKLMSFRVAQLQNMCFLLCAVPERASGDKQLNSRKTFFIIREMTTAELYESLSLAGSLRRNAPHRWQRRDASSHGWKIAVIKAAILFISENFKSWRNVN